MMRNRTLAESISWDAIADFWRMRGHVRELRRRNAAFRRHGDFWMPRSFRFGFGRWSEGTTILKAGFPKFK